MPLLEKLYEKNKDTLEIIAVTKESDISALKKFVSDNKITFKIVSDADGSISKKFPSKYIPFITVLGKDGEIVDIFGYNPKVVEEMENLVRNYTPAPPEENTDPLKLQRRGDEYFAKGRNEMAIMKYSKAIELKPRDFELYYYRGLSYNNIYEPEKAVADFIKASELNSKFYKSFYELGEYYRKDPVTMDKALDYLNKAIERYLEDAQVYFSRAMIFYAKKDYESAILDLDKAIEINPKLPDVKAYHTLVMGNIPGSKVPVPDCKFTLINGKKAKVSDFKGRKSVVIDMWASLSPSSAGEILELQKLYDQNPGKLEIILVVPRPRIVTDIVDNKAQVKDLNDFLKENKITFKVAIDKNYNVFNIYPTEKRSQRIIIDKDGNIIRTLFYESNDYKEQMKETPGLIKEIVDALVLSPVETTGAPDK